MLPLDSKLRRLPGNLATLQRLQFESLVFSTDSISFCQKQIEYIVQKYGVHITNISQEDRVSLFNNAWSIIDNVHVVRNLIRIILNGNMGERQNEFYENTKVATLLRNKMDHLNTNMPNLANARGLKAPLFGVISYFLIRSEDVIQSPEGNRLGGGSSVAIWAGNAVSAGSLIPMQVRPSGHVRIPFYEMNLYAFDLNIEFTSVIEKLSVVMNVMSESSSFVVSGNGDELPRAITEEELSSAQNGQLIGDGVLVLRVDFPYKM